jgi:hypothetical protein
VIIEKLVHISLVYCKGERMCVPPELKVFCVLVVQYVAQPRYRLQPPLNLHALHLHGHRCHVYRPPLANSSLQSGAVYFRGRGVWIVPMHRHDSRKLKVFLLLCVPGVHAHRTRTQRLWWLPAASGGATR